MLLKAFTIFAFISLSASAAIPDSSLFISAFNIQVFGKSKMSKPDVVASLVEIVQRYDITIIQEIRDIDEVAFPQLVADVNAADSRYIYDSFMSPRYGRTSSKEQYGYIYRRERVKLLTEFGYPDSRKDIFEREPHIAQFECLTGCQQSRFNTIVLHAKPDDAVVETSSLVQVYDYAVGATGLADAVILGDFNADCSYVTASDWPNVELKTDQRFTWLIDNDADTTVSTTHCAYDRIVTAGQVTGNSRGASIYDFETVLNLSYEEAKDVSDHYPVEFYVN